MNATQAYALNRKYTDESILGITGVLAGKNCTIKSSEKKDGITTVVFAWTADDGTERTTEIKILDGSPIYTWEPNTTYKFGDICIYASAFYRCIHDHTSGSTFNEDYWNSLNSADSQFDIVNDSTELPSTFTPADKRLFFSIADTAFWLWDGYKWELQTQSITNEEIDALFA